MFAGRDALLYIERGVKADRAVVRALVGRRIDTTARGLDFPGLELLLILDVDMEQPLSWVRSIFSGAFKSAPLPLQRQLRAHSPLFAFES